MKPGAGADRKPGKEDIDVVEGTMPPDATTKKSNSFLRWRSSAPKPKDDVKTREVLAPAIAEGRPSTGTDRGKFFEGVTSSGDGVQSKSNTLKKS